MVVILTQGMSTEFFLLQYFLKIYNFSCTAKVNDTQKRNNETAAKTDRKKISYEAD
jgi:hypothetical protein